MDKLLERPELLKWTHELENLNSFISGNKLIKFTEYTFLLRKFQAHMASLEN